MKSKTIILTLFGMLLFVSFSFAVEQQPADTSSPQAFIAQDIFEFEKVVDGIPVIHDFIIKNKGDAPLIIKKVQTG